MLVNQVRYLILDVNEPIQILSCPYFLMVHLVTTPKKKILLKENSIMEIPHKKDKFH